MNSNKLLARLRPVQPAEKNREIEQKASVPFLSIDYGRTGVSPQKTDERARVP